MYHNPIQPFLIFQGLALKDVKAKKVVACVEMKIAKSLGVSKEFGYCLRIW